MAKVVVSTDLNVPPEFQRLNVFYCVCITMAAAVLTTNHVMRRQDVIDFLGELTQTANAKTRDARSRSCASQFGTVGGAVTGAIVAGTRLAGVILETHYGEQRQN